MPLVRIAFRTGKSAQYRQAVADEVHRALVEVASVPELDRFQVLTEHAPADLIYDPTYLGVNRTDDIVMIQITLNQRTQAVKVGLYKAIAAKAGEKSRRKSGGCPRFISASRSRGLVVRRRQGAVR